MNPSSRLVPSVGSRTRHIVFAGALAAASLLGGGCAPGTAGDGKLLAPDSTSVSVFHDGGTPSYRKDMTQLGPKVDASSPLPPAHQDATIPVADTAPPVPDATIPVADTAPPVPQVDASSPLPPAHQDATIPVADTAPPPVCGDGTCQDAAGETCSSCAVDCGDCILHIASPGQPCGQVCSAAGLVPITAGTYINGASYHFCSANVQGEGFRPGFNLIWGDASPTDGTVCITGWDELALAAPTFRCACAVNTTAWSYVPGNGGSCHTACAAAGRQALSPGDYTLTGQPYYYCSTNAAGEGMRPGFNLIWGDAPPKDGTVCNTTWSDQVMSEPVYDCLCAD